MMKPSNPREFYLHLGWEASRLGAPISNTKFRVSDVHVIEKSAFDELMRIAEEMAEALQLGDSTTYPDPQHQEVVSRLGEQIGFGALMHSANYGWQQYLKKRGMPPGSEFVYGPCKSTRDSVLNLFQSFKQKLGGGE